METQTYKPGCVDDTVPFAQKLGDDYGIAVAQMISNDWLDSSGRLTANCELWNRSEYVRKKRLFVRGEYDVTQHKNAYNTREGALDLVNLRFRPINFAEKYCRIVANGISDKNYKLDVRATDRLSAMNKQAKRDRLTKYMLGKGIMQKMQAMGVKVGAQGDIPEDEKEIDIQMEIEDKPRIEIAEELLIDYIFKTNRWDFLGDLYDRDITNIGIMIARVYLDKNDGVKFAYVDPEYYFHSRVTFNDFSDKKYEGVVDTIPLSDVRRESGFDDETLKKIAKNHWPAKKTWIEQCQMSDLMNTMVPVMRFAYKTSKEIVYKKKVRGGETVKASLRTDEYSGPPNTRMSTVLDTWLEGNFILGTKFIYGYQECENLYDDVMNKALSPYVTIATDIYENRLKSFTTNIEEPVEMLQQAHLKIQHLLNELKPDGVAIDINMLAELDDGSGGTKQDVWQQALNLWETKGVAFVKTIDMGDQGSRTSTAITSLAFQQGTALAPALNVWAHYANQIREATGINPAADGTMSSDALVGVSELARMATNTVTRNVLDASVLFRKRLSEVISTRIHSIFRYKDAAHIKELYTNIVGKHMMDAIEVMKDRHLYEFGFTYEMYPTQEEISEFKQDLALAIQAGTIDPHVKTKAVLIARNSIKLATEFIAYHSRKKIKEAQEAEKAAAQWKSQNDAMAAQAKVQADTEAYSTKKMIDLEYNAKIIEQEVQKELALLQIRQPHEEREFQEEVFLTKLKSATEWDKLKYNEDRKDERTDLQASQQSKLKNQAQTGGPPIDFKSENQWFLS